MPEYPDEYAATLKVLVIGASGVGKTARECFFLGSGWVLFGFLPASFLASVFLVPWGFLSSSLPVSYWVSIWLLSGFVLVTLGFCPLLSGLLFAAFWFVPGYSWFGSSLFPAYFLFSPGCFPRCFRGRKAAKAQVLTGTVLFRYCDRGFDSYVNTTVGVDYKVRLSIFLVS